MSEHEPSPLMTPGQVATAFNVTEKSVQRWALRGQLTVVWTPGGHRRFRRTEVDEFLSGERGGSVYGGVR